MSKLIGTAARGGTRAGWQAWAAAQGAALVITAPVWAAGAPAANQAIGHAAADRNGAAVTWTLADGAPYLFIPYVGGKVSGAVAAVETGADVGAVLFQRPYFGTHDVGCVPELGSDSRADLKWRGATARFSPPVEPRASGIADGGADRFASLIVYRKDLGPPPGALLMNRRLTLGSPCGQAVHKTFFDRVFIPLAAPPEPARCYNLTGTYPQDGGKDIKVDFVAADRFVLLQPADLDDRYRGLRHRFRVTLYDEEGCRGGAGEFRSEGKESGDIKLASVGLRDRVRSVRIVYEGGPLAPYYRAPAAAPVAAKSPPPQPAKPKVATTEAAPPEPAPPEPAPPEKIPGAAAPEGGSDTAVPAQPAPPQSDTVIAAPAPDPSAEAQSAETTTEPALSKAQSTTLPLYAALPAPRLTLPAAEPAAPAPATASKTFEYPVHDIFRLNFCLRWGTDCGEPAATAWCKAQGFAKASAWTIDKDIGSLFPTIVLAESRVCAQFPCDGFAEITCIK